VQECVFLKAHGEIFMIRTMMVLASALAFSVVSQAQRPMPNPEVGLDGAATMHGDTYC
jgi:hypothetical protein